MKSHGTIFAIGFEPFELGEIGMKKIILQEAIEKKIFLLRGQKVMLDFHLAKLYGVETKAFKRSVKRNRERFPDDFMFQLDNQEVTNLRCQFGTSSWGGTRYLPYAFTEQGVAMLSSVLQSKRAIHVNIAIMRAFAKIKQMLFYHQELSEKLKQVEEKIEKHDKEITSIFEAIRQLMAVPEKPKRRIGFHADS